MLTKVKDLVRRRNPRPAKVPPEDVRVSLAKRCLTGSGLEIGALHNPLPVPAGVRVRYVDRLPVAELRRHYPELNGLPLVRVDILDDGETLTTVPGASQDFVIANHFLEHCQDTLGALKTLFRVLRPGGVLYAAVPDKRFTFDRDRPVTPLGHLAADHAHGPAGSRRQHLEEWVTLVNKVTDSEAAARQLRELDETGYSIHYHVWDQAAWLELLLAVRADLSLEVEAFVQHGIEMISILRKGQGR